uniref:HDC06795 n=1 Tax=Drosophila melanogaster TaxID=7227 RepID=Q6IGA6_DROME|nr:TPA_inf: HDC06795 [Drosophila melanogaster]
MIDNQGLFISPLQCSCFGCNNLRKLAKVFYGHHHRLTLCPLLHSSDKGAVALRSGLLSGNVEILMKSLAAGRSSVRRFFRPFVTCHLGKLVGIIHSLSFKALAKARSGLPPSRCSDPA